MAISYVFFVLPIRIMSAVFTTLFHSWFKLRWTPSSKSWLQRLDQKIRAKIKHPNHGEYVKVSLDNQVHDIWTVRVQGDKRDNIPIILIHGMVAGSCCFLNNIDNLAEQRDVILLDLPGFGLSSRPELRIKYEDGWWRDTNVDDIETFYCDILDKWFDELGLSKMVLLGHSYGGYLSSIYCLRHPERVEHLVLADPWGFPIRPAAADSRPFMANKSLYLLSRIYAKVNLFTPIRFLGPLGNVAFRTLRSDIQRKYNHHLEDNTVSEYLYACNTALSPASGEIGFSRLTIPFGWAKKPLLERVQDWDPDLDVTFIYGARSWVDSGSGNQAKNIRHDNYVDVHLISGAGHHVHADRPRAFNHIVQMVCTAVDQGRQPHISHEFDTRSAAMSMLRQQSTNSFQADFINDEAGVRIPRNLNQNGASSSSEPSTHNASNQNSTVKFSLDSTYLEETDSENELEEEESE